jgi:hypothetical protein
MDEQASDNHITFVQSGTSGAYDMYALSNPVIPADYQAKRIIIEANAQQTVAQQNQHIQLGYQFVGAGGIVWGDQEEVNTTWRHFKHEIVDFDPEQINNLEAGVKVV